MNYPSAASTGSPRQAIDSALASLEASVAGLLPWVWRLHSPAQGGFHLALSALTDPERFPCTIDTTAQAVKILECAEALPRLAPEVRASLVRFFQKRQDPRTGFFFDPIEAMRADPRLVGRALDYAVRSLASLGAAPLHPLPREESVLELYPELSSPAAFRAWLEGLDWSQPYGRGDRTGVRIRIAAGLPEPLRTDLLDAAFAFLSTIQSPRTGFWGLDPARRDHHYVSGVMKLTVAFREAGRPVPHADLIARSVVWTIAHDHEVDSNYCYVRNPLTALKNLLPQLSTPLSAAERTDAIVHSVAHHLRFAQADGGFSRSTRAAFRGEHGLHLGLGLAEGDLNAATQTMHTVRPLCHLLAGRTPPPPQRK